MDTAQSCAFEPLAFVQTNSKPSHLKITDLRFCVVARAPMTCVLLRIDTNQDIYGVGELRDGASMTYALMLKSRIVGENPCNVDQLFRKVKQFGGHSRQGGGVSAIEMALWDLAGKTYGAPVYQMLGGKFRDRVRCYADTDETPDAAECGRRLKARMEQGFTWLKMDLGIHLIQDQPGMVVRPPGMDPSRDTAALDHHFTGIQITDRGIAALSDYAAAVRECIGGDIPLAIDHFGRIGLNSCIRLGKALEKHCPAWLEDMIPWQYTALWKQITDAVEAPTMTGEDIYLKEGFEALCQSHAVDMIHPDLASAGGIFETKKIGDAAQAHGVPMVLHCAGTPVACLANVHCAAATENFLALEHHSVDVPWWGDLVDGVEKPIVDRGFIRVPETPGLGVTLNDDAVRRRLRNPGFFDPTPEWNGERSWDALFS